MKTKIEQIIYNYIRENFGESEAEDPCYAIEPLAKEIAKNIKLYEMEYEAEQFAKGWHTLQEWADYGINAVIYDGKRYWDGKLDGFYDIEGGDIELELDYWDFDEDGYRIAYLKEIEKGE